MSGCVHNDLWRCGRCAQDHDDRLIQSLRDENGRLRAALDIRTESWLNAIDALNDTRDLLRATEQEQAVVLRWVATNYGFRPDEPPALSAQRDVAWPSNSQVPP